MDNSLVRDPDGTIVGRNGGIKQWLRENCAELGKRYHTVMRYKALAKRFKQAIDLEDPVPVAYALAAAESPVEVVVGDPGDRAAEMQLRRGPKSNSVEEEGVAPGTVTEGAMEGATEMQLRCGPSLTTNGDGGCVVEVVTPERFDLLRGSAMIADGCRRMARIMAAGENAREFFAGLTTKKNLDERLALLLEPDRTPTSPRGSHPRSRFQGRGVSASALA